MKHPSWEDVNIPKLFVNYVKTLPPSHMLDGLINQFVFRNKRKPYHTYICANCSHIYVPNRQSEEIPAVCFSCKNGVMKLSMQLKWPKEFTPYSRRHFNAARVMEMMHENYCYYFNKSPSNSFNCGWLYGNPYSQFCGGDIVSEVSTKICILKAALMCPYLWDMSFNWSQIKGEDTLNTEHLSATIHGAIFGLLK